MEDEVELQAKIVNLAGRINRHKTGDGGQHGSGMGKPHNTHDSLLNPGPFRGQAFRPRPHRTAPYGAYDSQAWTSKPVPHRNKSLVLNGATGITTASTTSSDAPPLLGWISRRDRHLQLINTSVYDKEVQGRTAALERTRRSKQIERERRERTMMNNHLRTLPREAASDSRRPAIHHIYVGNIRFLVANGGSKLVRTEGEIIRHMNKAKTLNDGQDEMNKTHNTPKRVDVGGVTFHRSKHGNLYRTGLIKIQRSGAASGRGCHVLADHLIHRQGGSSKIQKPCQQFSTTGTRRLHSHHNTCQQCDTTDCKSAFQLLTTSTGSCAKGPACRYIHDPQGVAMCKDFLQKGECPAGEYCDLSHHSTPERVPACLHFQRGSCTNPACMYSHVRVNPGAPVCKAFATYGFCPQGIKCAERHVHECPDYANKGFCRNDKCRLPHVDRAGKLRKAAAKDAGSGDDAMSDISSDVDHDSDDVDSDEIDEELLKADPDSHELSQQEDFVRL